MSLSVERLKELRGLLYPISPESQTYLIIRDKGGRIADGEANDIDAALRELIAIKEAEPVAWAVLNGVCIYSTYSKELIAKTIAAEQQRSHDLSGSLAAFSHCPLIIKPE